MSELPKTRIRERIEEELEQLTNEIDGVWRPTDRRTAVIDQRDYDTLVEYLSFRHMVRHNYPGTLNWNRFRKIAQSLAESHTKIDHRIRQFLTETLDQRLDETER